VKASVIVPVRDGARVIERCLRALERQHLSPDSFEIIVVDDGSTDGTAALVEQFPAVRLLRQAPSGPAAARNLGAGAARGELLLFTDADCAPESDWARRLAEAVDRTGAAGGKGIYSTQQSSLVARFVQVEYETKYARMVSADSIDFVDTYSAVYRRDVFEAVGGFDERLPSTSLEDQELSFRVAESGYRMIFVQDAVVEHLHPSTLWAYVRKKFSIGYWKVAVLRLHPGKALRDSHTPETQKLQIALTGLLGVALLLTFPVPSVWPVDVVLALALVASWVPFLRYALGRDRTVAWVSPGLLLVRAMAQGCGFLWGMLRLRGYGGT